MGTQLPSPKKGTEPPPNYGPFLLWPNSWMHQDATWYGGRLQPRRLFVRWDPAPPPKGGRAPCPIFGPFLFWPKMPVGREVSLGPDDIVLDEDTAPCPKSVRSPSPIFGPYLLWPNGWMDQDATWYGGRPRPRRRCVRWRPRSLPKKGRAPNFRLMFIVAKRQDGSRWHLVRR